MKIMMLGDVYSTPGRTLLTEHCAKLKEKYAADFVIVNGENASGGHGLTRKNADELLSLPIDVITMGNHVWNQREIVDYIEDYPQIIRPANYPDPCPGRGLGFFEKNGVRIAVLNLSGQVFMPEMGECPFNLIQKLYDDQIKDRADIFIVDFHAEATSEKLAMGYFLDGKASIVVGTHTHVQTADAQILPGGTAYITDLGMTGAFGSVIGVEKDIIIRNMLTKRPERFLAEKNKPWQINGIAADIDETTGRARSIERIYEIIH